MIDSFVHNKVYNTGDRVAFLGKVWEAAKDSFSGIKPSLYTIYWKIVLDEPPAPAQVGAKLPPKRPAPLAEHAPIKDELVEA